MPRPTGSSASYRPGLDGIRAIAVAGVIAYHLDAPWMPGGLLGVGVFFTLSGYLITSILVRTWERHGTMRLGAFWLARARRLLPALFLMLAAVLLATAFVATHQLGDRAWQSLFAAAYIANWADIVAGDSYFDATSPLGPLDHLWSLSIEEQFYVVWPLLLWGLILLTRARRVAMGILTLALAAASFAALAVIAEPGLDNTRAYEGTDTRAGALLVGAALALLWRGGIYAKGEADAGPATAARRAPWWLDCAAGVGLATILTLMATMPDHTMALYQGGLAALAIATAALVAAAAHPRSITARALGVVPLRWIGERSYGIYLWHVPVIVFLPQGVLGGSPWLRGMVVTAITLAISALSWTLVEDPIRRHGFRTVFRWRPLRLLGDDAPRRLKRVPTVAATMAVLGVGVLALSGATAVPSARAPTLASAVVNDKPGPLWGLPVDEALEASLLVEEHPSTRDAPGTTACTSVLHVGDSSSLGIIDEKSLPNPADRMPAQYERVGVEEPIMDILGARSVVERYKGEPNAQDAVASALANGFDGCFVIAMGLNEAANVAVGGQASLVDRIELIQALVGDAPTMWITVKTLRTRGPWADVNMAGMNQALYDACRRHPSMRVYDWASEAPDSWYSSDRIHFTSEGDRERAHRIANALAASFPATGPQVYQCRVESAWGAAPKAP